MIREDKKPITQSTHVFVERVADGWGSAVRWIPMVGDDPHIRLADICGLRAAE